MMGEYPLEWIAGIIQREAYARAGWRCEHCGCEFVPGSTRALTARNADGSPTILRVHHLDGNRANCDWTNLVAVCQRCHLHIQAVWQPGGVLPGTWWPVPEWILERGLTFRVEGIQLRLWG